MGTILHRGLIFVLILNIIAGVYVPSTIDFVKADSNIIYVDDDANPGWYDATHVRTIQAGINNVTSGGIVLVKNGTYLEHVTVNKQISLVGENRSTTVIEGNGTSDVVLISSDWVNIRNFSIVNSGSADDDAGIDLDQSSNCTVKNCNCSNNNRFGIYLKNGAVHNTIENNSCYYNSLDAIRLIGSNNTIKNNICCFNDFAGIVIASSNFIVENNTFNSNKYGIAWSYSDNVFNCTIRNNTCKYNSAGIKLHCICNGILEYNICTSNTRGIEVDYSSYNLIRNNVLSSNSNAIYITDYEDSNGHNLLQNNKIVYNSKGVYIGLSNNNQLLNNTIANNSIGIDLAGTDYNNITYNNVYSNSNFGISSRLSNSNNIFLNDFIHNTNNVYSETSENRWSSPQQLKYLFNNSEFENHLGNYWSDHNTFDIDGDGIAEAPYTIDGQSDMFPLNKTFNHYTGVHPKIQCMLNETWSNISTFDEEILFYSASANVSMTGDINGTLNFTDFKFVFINSGSFKDKGFIEGNWSAHIENINYNGTIKGMLYKSSNVSMIQLKGVLEGGLRGSITGMISESISGSGIYDFFNSSCTVFYLGGHLVYAEAYLQGNVSCQEFTHFQSELYVLQSLVEGYITRNYDTPIDIVLTLVRIDNETNTLHRKGFSVLTFITDFGSGEGWTFTIQTSHNVYLLNGLSTNPLDGVITGLLNETVSPRSLVLEIERIDLGLPPRIDLNVRTWGMQRASPGETIDYIIEYSNLGLKSSEEVLLFVSLDANISFRSSSQGTYHEFYHMVSWNLGEIPPKTSDYLSIQGEVSWGLSEDTRVDVDCFMIHFIENDNICAARGINIAANGIDHNRQKNPNGYKAWNNFSHGINAVQIPNLYQSGDLLQDIIDVQKATPGSHYEANENNGLAYFEEMELISSDTVTAYSGGTRTVVTAVLNGNLQCDRLILISPIAGAGYSGHWKDEMESIRHNHPDMEIIIYQSKKDVLATKYLSWIFQAKFSKSDISWLKENNIKVNPGTDEFAWDQNGDGTVDPFSFIEINGKLIDIDKDEINKKNHGGLFQYINKKVNKNTAAGSDSDLSCSTIVTVAKDPNAKYGPRDFLHFEQNINYTIEYENEGEGIAFGVYFTDILEEDLDDSTLEIGPVLSNQTGLIIAPPGLYNPNTRTITWFVGEVGPGEGGKANISINLRADAVETEVINFATVYFPSVPETTRTNGVVSIIDIVPPRYSHVNQNKSKIIQGDRVSVSAFWEDGIQLDYIWLATNESGIWTNVSYIKAWSNGWSNFSIQPKNASRSYWRIYANDTAGNMNVTPIFSFDVLPNNKPIITSIYPQNGSTNVERPPTQLNATVVDSDGNLMNLLLRFKNHSNLWETLLEFSNIGNETYGFTTPYTNDWLWGNTTYTWSVNVTDGIYWTNKTFTFTTGGSRYDVNNDDKVNFIDAGIVWVHRTTNAVYDGLYDVNQDGTVNFIDAGLTWVNRD